MRLLRRGRMLRGVLLGSVCAVLAGSPAGAHGVGGPVATNFRTEILEVSGALPGVSFSIVEFGEQVELANRGRLPVRVLAADGRVMRNVLAGKTVRWHEHSVHWMGSQLPPAVAAAPGRSHVVIPRWELRLVAGNSEMLVVGRLMWKPNESVWPWVLLTGVVLAGCLLLLRMANRLRASLLVVFAIGVAAAGVVRGVGVVMFDASRWDEGLWREAPIIAGAALLIVGIAAALRGSGRPWGWLAAGAMAIGLASGFVDVTWWSQPFLPTRIPVMVDRLLISLVISLSLALVLMAFRGLLGLSAVAHGARTTTQRGKIV